MINAKQASEKTQEVTRATRNAQEARTENAIRLAKTQLPKYLNNIERKIKEAIKVGETFTRINVTNRYIADELQQALEDLGFKVKVSQEPKSIQMIVEVEW